MAKRTSWIARVPLGASIGVLFGAVAAALIAATPAWMFEDAVGPYGLPGGTGGRLLAAGFALVVIALLVWGLVEGATRAAALYRSIAAETDEDELDLATIAVPEVERPRRPIFADRELGAPFMSDQALETAAPLVLTDPVAEPVAEIAREPVPEAVADPVLAEPLAVEEFDLPPVDEPAEPIAEETSIEALIRRLEAGLAKRNDAPPPPEAPPPAMPVVTRSWLARDDGDDAPRAINTLRAMARR